MVSAFSRMGCPDGAGSWEWVRRLPWCQLLKSSLSPLAFCLWCFSSVAISPTWIFPHSSACSPPKAKNKVMAPFPVAEGLPLAHSPTPATEASPTIEARQSEETVTCDSSGGTSLGGGEITGIVIGTIAGTLLLLWLIRSCFNIGAPPTGDREKVFRHVEPEHRRRHRSKRRSHSRRRSVDLDVPPAAYYKESSGGRGRRYYV